MNSPLQRRDSASSNSLKIEPVRRTSQSSSAWNDQRGRHVQPQKSMDHPNPVVETSPHSLPNPDCQSPIPDILEMDPTVQMPYLPVLILLSSSFFSRFHLVCGEVFPALASERGRKPGGDRILDSRPVCLISLQFPFSSFDCSSFYSCNGGTFFFFFFFFRFFFPDAFSDVLCVLVLGTVSCTAFDDVGNGSRRVCEYEERELLRIYCHWGRRENKPFIERVR